MDELDELRIVLLGFGNANRSLARMLLEKSEFHPHTTHSTNDHDDGDGDENDDDDDDPRAHHRRRRCLRIPVVAGGGRCGGAATRLVPWRIVCIVTRNHGRAHVSMLHPDDIDDISSTTTTTTTNVTTNVTSGGEGVVSDVTHHHPQIDVEGAIRLVESGRTLDSSIGVGGRGGDDIVVTDSPTDVEDTLRLLDALGRKKERRPTTTDDDDDDDDPKTMGRRRRLRPRRRRRPPPRENVANIVVEAISSDTKGGGEPAISYIRGALAAGMHVVSANKGPLMMRHRRHRGTATPADGEDDGEGVEEVYWELQRLASTNNVTYQHESSVLDGVPVFSLWKYALPHARLISIRGCLNVGWKETTKTTMETTTGGGMEFHDALHAARCMGIVETDESLDIDGYDAAAKLRALLVVLSSRSHSPEGVDTTTDERGTMSAMIPTMDEIHRDTIRYITREDVRRARANGGMKYRLVASAKMEEIPPPGGNDSGDRVGWKWDASVRLVLLPPSDPLYNLNGTDSSVQFHTDVLGPITIVSTNPTLVDTAYGLFSDIVRVASGSK
ncbi:hypothetical protein ACHAXA_004926 [Cyclostephanos tholiformis]|uniref:Homoserine dehydrogenase catalytic domain-containing protein n=1 Tax=Cyclostephanos tholiformis TaxID=382380 RepID=A0ABD3RS10_9STRA